MPRITKTLPDHLTVKLPFPASIAVAVFDLMYWDNAAGTVKKASQQADQLSEAANQRLFAGQFAGVSQDQRLSSEATAADRVVITDGVFDCSCPSLTWEVGDLIGPSENAAGDGLENQQVEKVTDPFLAIGYCVQREATAKTTVRARLISKIAPADKPGMGYPLGFGGTVTQITSASTGVALSKLTGQITTVALTTAAAAEERFTVTNTLVSSVDTINLSTTYNGAGTPMLGVLNVTAGAFDIVITNLHAANALNAAMTINFTVIKGAAS